MPGDHRAAGLKGASVVRRKAEAVTCARVEAAGFPTQRTDAEWVAHPTALDDLLRVMGGMSIREMERERRAERIARGAA